VYGKQVRNKIPPGGPESEFQPGGKPGKRDSKGSLRFLEKRKKKRNLGRDGQGRAEKGPEEDIRRGLPGRERITSRTRKGCSGNWRESKFPVQGRESPGPSSSSPKRGFLRVSRRRLGNIFIPSMP